MRITMDRILREQRSAATQLAQSGTGDEDDKRSLAFGLALGLQDWVKEEVLRRTSMKLPDLMTPANPRWTEFIDKLSGPGFCHFREVVRDGKDDFAFNCDNTFDRPKAQAAMRQMGLSERAIDKSLGYMAAFGGFCDCEVVFNVESSYDSIYRRGKSRKPRRNHGELVRNLT